MDTQPSTPNRDRVRDSFGYYNYPGLIRIYSSSVRCLCWCCYYISPSSSPHPQQHPQTQLQPQQQQQRQQPFCVRSIAIVRRLSSRNLIGWHVKSTLCGPCEGWKGSFSEPLELLPQEVDLFRLGTGDVD
mmetsp:Transcript_24737/g.33929  ORF Transcript_24737/g.33929 Transcript_24737/m.33929 type:complete len:130 (+) Transcript_24737:275-664(+)